MARETEHTEQCSVTEVENKLKILRLVKLTG